MASTPICRCRVLYLGSAVPHITKDGLHGIQEPLRELYPEEGVYGAKGIDSWLSVWSNGLLLENVDEKHKRVTRFFPIESLHYCAAVRHVRIPGATDGDAVERFLPLDSPFARVPSPHNPPLFACILRRVAGIKVLECHAFVCKKEMAANALVRCCFHAYADNTYAKRLETGSVYSEGAPKMLMAAPTSHANGHSAASQNGGGSAVNPIQKVEQWRAYVPGDSDGGGELASIYDGGADENHKVWPGAGTGDDQQSIYADYASTIRSVKSMNGAGMHRSNRPRQLASPSSPPPPPPPITTVATIEALPNGKKKESKPKGRAAVNGGGQNGHPPPRRYPPMSASEFRPVWPPRMRPPGPPPPHATPHGYPMAMLPPHLMGPRMPPGLIPVPPPQVPHAPKSAKGRSAEEPVYMPSGRALSPVSSYKPGAFPYEQYYLNQQGSPHSAPHYSNGGHPSSHYNNGGHPSSHYNNGGHPSPPYSNGIHPSLPYGNGVHPSPSYGNGAPASPQYGNGTHHPAAPQYGGGASPTPQYGTTAAPAPTGKSSKYKKKKDKDTSDSDSKFNTGIYRKKGHLNERAFSYSIRQEHRSRSHSSLATLTFAEPNNGHSGSVANGNGTLNGHAVTNGKSPVAEHARTNGKVNGKMNGKMNGKANGTGKPAKKGGKLVKTMNDLSLSDGEIEEIGPAEIVNGQRKKGTTGNHR